MVLLWFQNLIPFSNKIGKSNKIDKKRKTIFLSSLMRLQVDFNTAMLFQHVHEIHHDRIIS